MGIRSSLATGPAALESTTDEGRVQLATPSAKFIPSPEQEAIFDWFEHPRAEDPNLVVVARAGTGKTTTIIRGIDRAPEEFVLVTSFNRRIIDEVNARMTRPGAEAKTLHSLGYTMVRRQWARMGVAKGFDRTEQITNWGVAAWEQEVKEKVPFGIRRLIGQIHTKAREIIPFALNHERITQLMFRFDLVPDEAFRDYPVEKVAELAALACVAATKNPPTRDVGIDYADMIFLPLRWDLTARDYHLGVVDEAQDMSMAQLELFERSIQGRICIVGDDRQAIYGFRGADSKALARLTNKLNAKELPLKTTYRCGHNIVEYAQNLVPDFEAGEKNPDGVILELAYTDMLNTMEPGDFVLSRLNAPLVACVYALLKRGVRAKIAGRDDVGKAITKILGKLKVSQVTPIETTLELLEAWERKQCAKYAAYSQDDLIERCHDQCGVLYAVAEECETTGDLLEQCEKLFAGDDEGQVVASTIHKAKGLEARRVAVLMDTLYTRGDSEEEQNIEYVAVTRAKEELIFVRDTPSMVARKLKREQTWKNE